MKEITTEEKNKIRQNWCNQLCSIFNKYVHTGQMDTITCPHYTCQVLSSFDVLDFGKIDFKEYLINTGETRTKNENLIIECFDKLIIDRIFIGDLMKDFRGQYSLSDIPF